jgi:hypothetical protein
VNFGTAAGTVAAGDHTHNYDTNYVNVSGDTMTGNLVTSGTIGSTGFRTGDYVIDATGIRTVRTDVSSLVNPAINIMPGTDDLPGLPGDINIKGSWAGNDSGGNVTVESGRTSPFTTSGGHSKTTLAGGDISGRANTGSRIELQGGISAGGGSADVRGGTITITGGSGNGTGPGGNVIILPGPGGTNGNVGIGTANPAYKLDVSGSLNASSSLCIAGSCVSSWASAGQWSASGGNIFYNGGNVGIGTSGPVAKVDVAGTVKAAGFIGDGSGLTNLNIGTHSHSGPDIISGTVSTARLSVGTAAGTVAAGDHTHNYDSSYVNAAGDSMTGALNVSVNSGGGNAITATNSGIGAASNAVSGINTGTGHGGNFEINNTGSPNVALVATTNGNGNALRAQAFGGGDTLYSYTTGSGKAGLFQVINAANSNDAVHATTNGTGHAGKFDITNAGSPNVSLHVTTIGSGNAVRAETSGGGDALYAYTTGFGKTGRFQINNPASANDALYATTNGSGNAGRFDGTVTVSGTVTASAFLGDGSGLTGSAPVAANNFATKGYVDSRIPNAVLHVPFGMSCPAGFTKEFSGIISVGIYGQVAPLDVCTSSAYTLVVYIDAAQTCPVGWTQLDMNTPVMGSVAADACYK